MSQPRGYLIVRGDGLPTRECDTVCCPHCTAVVKVGAGAPLQASGWCGRCAQVVCARCATDGRCRPFETVLARQASRERFYRAVLP